MIRLKPLFIIVPALIIALGLATGNAQAHGADYSVLLLTEQSPNQWRLRVSASLEAFRKEVKLHYKDEPYTSAQQFEQQLLQHIKQSLTLHANGKYVALGEGEVTLGHESSVVFKNISVPPNTAQLQVVNGATKDIYKHTSKLFVASISKNKTSYVLNKVNAFTADVRLN